MKNDETQTAKPRKKKTGDEAKKSRAHRAQTNNTNLYRNDCIDTELAESQYMFDADNEQTQRQSKNQKKEKKNTEEINKY